MPTKKADPHGAEVIAEELRPLHRLEEVADNLGRIAGALDTLSQAAILRVLAEYGSDTDRELVVKTMNRWVEEFEE